MKKSEVDIDIMANMFKLLGNETRLTIIMILYQKECCVCELVEAFSMSQPAISQHLRRLSDANVVNEERRGQWVYYSLNKKSLSYRLIEKVTELTQDPINLVTNIKNIKINC